jgi:hypothetical protein
LELRAAMSLSRLWQAQGQYDAARTLLADIYGWLSEGLQPATCKKRRHCCRSCTTNPGLWQGLSHRCGPWPLDHGSSLYQGYARGAAMASASGAVSLVRKLLGQDEMGRKPALHLRAQRERWHG